MVLIISCVVVLFLWFCTLRTITEQKLLKKDVYKQAVDEWERLQVLCLCDPAFRFTSFVMPLDPGDPVSKTVTVRKDYDGKMIIPSGLKPSEFIVFVNELKRILAFMKGREF